MKKVFLVIYAVKNFLGKIILMHIVQFM
ncbi:unnamed protein product [Larinioides sclopetarius]|uniref:Uncharacterized protein n=1 Tax=Larinioides sclopetarius TaxID=280406 RepID=A0AAV1ZC77_9ARAC